MNKKTKLLSLVLAMIMALACFGICAFAAGENYLTFNYIYMDEEKKFEGFFILSRCVKSASGEINVPSTHTALVKIKTGDEIEERVVTRPVISIASNAFEDAERITKVTIPASVTSVGSSAFENCALLGTVEFAGEECTIGTAAFRYCSTLKVLTLPSKLEVIPIEAFANCTALGSVDFPQTLTTISKEAFKRCTALQSVTVPASVTSIGQNAFLDCASVKSYKVTAGNTAYKTVSDCLYDYSGNTLIQYPNGKTATSFAVPAGTKTVADSAFGSNTKLTKVTLPTGLETITAYAFNQCSALEEINIPASVTYIGSQAFGGCKKLKSITIPSKVEEYSGAFYNSGLETVTIENGVKAIDEKAFERCASLKNVSIPSSVTEIRMGAFDNCTALELLEVPESVTTIGINAFVNCGSLTLKVKKDSVAHTYALENNVDFELIGGGNVEPEKTVVSISIKTNPTKTSYTAGEKINTAGMVIAVNYSDGTTATATSGFELDTQYATGSGTKTVTVKYKGKTATFTITVSPASAKTVVGMQIQKLPDKVDYNYKSTLSTAGMVLLVEYSDGTTGTVTNGYKVSATELNKTGAQTVEVSYEGFTDEFTVSVTYAWWQLIIMILLLGFLWY